MTDLPRIGREPNPAERGYQLIAENAHVLERAARNLYAARRHGEFPGDRWVTGVQIDAEWAGMSQGERETWKEEALAVMRKHVEDYREPEPPDDPDPGVAVA